MVAIPAATKTAHCNGRCIRPGSRLNQKAAMTTVRSKVKVMSKMTTRAKTSTRGQVANTTAALSPQVSPNIERASCHTTSIVNSAANAEGNLAAHSETPESLNDAATSQKNTAG